MGAAVWLVGIEAAAAGAGTKARLAIKVSTGILVYFLALRQLSRPAYSQMMAELARFGWNRGELEK
jgi:hypothetical protein